MQNAMICVSLSALILAGCHSTPNTADASRRNDTGSPVIRVIADYTKKANPVCAVHGVQMRRYPRPVEPVSVGYGSYEALSDKRFPNADRAFVAGDTFEGEYSMGYICPACCKAMHAWLEDMGTFCQGLTNETVRLKWITEPPAGGD